MTYGGEQQSKSRQNSQDVSGSCLKVEDNEGEEGCVEDLSCATMTWEETLSNSMDRADRLKGESLSLKVFSLNNIPSGE